MEENETLEALTVADAPTAPTAPQAPAPDAPAAPAAPVTLIEGKEYTVRFTGFSFVRDYVSFTGKIGDLRVSGIVGTRSQYPISEIRGYTGLNLIMAFKGTAFSASGTEYNRFQIVGFDGL